MITNEKILIYAKSYLKEGLKGIDLTIEKNGGKAEASLKRLRSDIQVEIKCIEEQLKHETATDENNMQWRPITIFKKRKGQHIHKRKGKRTATPTRECTIDRWQARMDRKPICRTEQRNNMHGMDATTRTI